MVKLPDEPKHVLIYTDGACDPNPGGPGGYAAILVYQGKKKEISGGFRATTNNRMEIYAAIQALESLKEPCQVTLYTDSKYLMQSIEEGWAKRWKENDWWRTKDERAVNPDLWEKLLTLCETHTVKFKWVKGHVGHPENERCDVLSTRALKQKNLAADEGYENRSEEAGGKVKITQEGQPCRKCNTPVVKRTPKKPKPDQAYYYEYYFFCPKCETMYMVEEAKRDMAEYKAPSLF
ncbi:MAG: hypothetical protein Fur0022_35530 [Anaerolineales bacterium]